MYKMDRLDLVLDECLKEKTKKEIYDYVVKKLNYKDIKPKTRKKKQIVCRPVMMISDSSDNEN